MFAADGPSTPFMFILINSVSFLSEESNINELEDHVLFSRKLAPASWSCPCFSK